MKIDSEELKARLELQISDLKNAKKHKLCDKDDFLNFWGKECAYLHVKDIIAELSQKQCLKQEGRRKNVGLR